MVLGHVGERDDGASQWVWRGSDVEQASALAVVVRPASNRPIAHRGEMHTVLARSLVPEQRRVEWAADQFVFPLHLHQGTCASIRATDDSVPIEQHHAATDGVE